MNGLSEVEKARIKAAFEKLGEGDVITGKEIKSLVVIRHIGNRVVIGLICGCGKRHIAEVPNQTFAWSDELEAMVDEEGTPAKWWSPDLQVSRLEAVDIAKMSAGIPVDADYRVLPENERTTLVARYLEQFKACQEVLHYGNSRKASVRRALELVGIKLSDEQAFLLFSVLAFEESEQEERSMFEAVKMIAAAASQDH